MKGIRQVFTREQIAEHVSNRLGSPSRVLLATERTERVFDLIRARVAIGFLWHESNRGRYPCCLELLEKSLNEYKQTRNIDALLDVALYAIAGFQDPSMKGTFYEPNKIEQARGER